MPCIKTYRKQLYLFYTLVQPESVRYSKFTGMIKENPFPGVMTFMMAKWQVF